MRFSRAQVRATNLARQHEARLRRLREQSGTSPLANGLTLNGEVLTLNGQPLTLN